MRTRVVTYLARGLDQLPESARADEVDGQVDPVGVARVLHLKDARPK